jgi:hypothetical protein
LKKELPTYALIDVLNERVDCGHVLAWKLSGLLKVRGGGKPRGAYEFPEVGLRQRRGWIVRSFIHPHI